MTFGLNNSQKPSLRGPTGSVSGSKVPSGYSQGSLQQFSPEQMQLFQQLFIHTDPQSFTSKLAGGDQSGFDALEAPELRQFNQLQGNIASRFSGMGGQGALSSRNSSGFKNTLNAASSNFAQDLASKRMGLQRQAMQDLMGMSKELLGQRPYEQFLVEPAEKQSFWQKFLGGAAPIAGAGIGGFFGGPAGAVAGSQIGSAFGSAFSGGGSPQMNFSGIGNLPTSWQKQGNMLSGARGMGQSRSADVGMGMF